MVKAAHLPDARRVTAFGFIPQRRDRLTSDWFPNQGRLPPVRHRGAPASGVLDSALPPVGAP